jgi:tetratricopeptide (TPR) repeat protein
MMPDGIGEPDIVGRIRRGKRYRSVGAVGAITSLAVLAASKLIPLAGGALSAILLTSLVISLGLIAWTRLWFRESREPFRYTYSVGKFEPVPPLDPEARRPVDPDPFTWLTHDLKEKLSERVPRLSLLDEETVPKVEPEDGPASHVHISGWYGLRRDDQGWEFEVVPEVRLGGEGAPARLATSVRLRLDASTSVVRIGRAANSPKLSEEGYGMLFERVYWSVASQIYAQIHRGVKEKVALLPWGGLRASAYVTEAEDYATSNTLDAYAAAQQLFRQALAIYDVRYREPAASQWRERGYKVLKWISDRRRSLRRRRASVWRRAGRRDVMTARAELGLARTLVAEWHLGELCGMFRKEIYESTEFVDRAIERLRHLPVDIAERQTTMFRADVTRATIKLLLGDQPGGQEALRNAEKLLPTKTREDADYLFVAGMIEPDLLPSLRLFGKAVELEPTMERALFHRAEQYDEIWRRRDPFEYDMASTVDEQYRAVIALNPGNLSAWARRGYLGWLLAEEETSGKKSGWWREQAISALHTGRQYKEVRRDASVAELDWNLARLAAEDGDVVAAYGHYIDAVSARLADPRINFEQKFFLSPTEALTARFWRYQRTAMVAAERAEAEGVASPRLIAAVKAFVLNDCGLAYQAHYERSGSEKSLMWAWGAFKAARREDDTFILPAHNLAKLFQRHSDLPGSSLEEMKQALQSAIGLLDDVLRREPKWAPAQLLMVEVQAELAAVVAGLLQASDDGAAEGGVGEVVGADLEAVQAARTADRMNELQETAHAAAVRELRALLPHEVLVGADGQHRIDLAGTHVTALLDDRSVRWTKDFDAFHVAALIRWSGVLATTAPSAANRLCGRLRDKYSNADVRLLNAHRLSALAEVDTGEALDPQQAADARSTINECDAIYCEIVRAALRRDPAHLAPLKATLWLPVEERRRALLAALDAKPSATALVWIGDAQKELGDLEAAIMTYERARAGRGSVAPIAALKLARLLRDRDTRKQDAVEAYRAATISKDPSVAADGAAGAAAVLRTIDEAGEARGVCREAAARPEVAVILAGTLEREELTDEAIFVLRQALRSKEDAPLHAELKIRLALALMSAAEGRDLEAESLLLEVGESGLPPLAWEAKLILARALTADEAGAARQLYHQLLAEADPMAVAMAASELGAIMESAEETEAAAELYLERARMDSAVASRLAQLMRERGEDGDAFIAEVEADEPPSVPLGAAA